MDPLTVLRRDAQVPKWTERPRPRLLSMSPTTRVGTVTTEPVGSRFDRMAATSLGVGRQVHIALPFCSTGVFIRSPPVRFIYGALNVAQGTTLHHIT